MPMLTPEAIRTIALVGHGGCGKTTLAEALLHKAGMIGAMGFVEKGSTVCDFDPLEKSYQHSLNASLVHLHHRDTRIHLADTPGLPDFIGRAIGILPAVETAAKRPSARRNTGAKRSSFRSKVERDMTHTLVSVATPGERGCPCGRSLDSTI